MSIAAHCRRIAGGAYDNAGDKAGFMAARAYRYWRALGRPAGDALRLARLDAEKETGRYPVAGGAGAPGERGGRWMERPESLGFRFVGFSDELRDGGRNSHSGWFLYPEGDPAEVARGCVYQLPARKGRPVYVEALRTGETLRTRSDWRDMGESGSALIFPGAIHYGDKGGDEYSSTSDSSDAVKDAARGADREAEIYAEAERDYQAAWQAGSRCADLETESADERKAARELVAELRAHFNAGGKLGAAMCATLRGAIRSHIRDASKAASKARELAEEFAPWTRPSWAASYQEKYGRDPFPNGNAEADRLAEAFAEGRGQ